MLRIVGCSLSSNDAHLIDLLFKAHLEKSDAFEMEVIDKDQTGKQIRSQYGFFPKIRSLLELDDPMIPDSDPINPFKSWLKYKCLTNAAPQIIIRKRSESSDHFVGSESREMVFIPGRH